jgi:tight adherence protein F
VLVIQVINKIATLGINLFSSFRKSESGIVSVEAAGYFIVFFMLCAFLSDWSVVFLDKSRIERVNNSISTVLRERNVLYSGQEEISDDNAEELFNLAEKLMENSRVAGRDYAVTIDAVYFSDNNKVLQVAKTDTFTKSRGGCQVNKPAVGNIVQLSAWSADEGRWLPVYQVTLCVKGKSSLFMQLGNLIGFTVGDLSVSNVVVPRVS